MATGIAPYHQLTVDDFPIDDKAHPKNAFYIRAAISPHYHFFLKIHGGFFFATIDQWMIFSGFRKTDTNRKGNFKQMKESLPYVQAILDINEICARKLAAMKEGELPEARGNTAEDSRANLNAKLKVFLDAKYKGADAEGEAFMEATGHGANKKKVRELAAEIRKRLDATPATTVPFSSQLTPNPTPTAGPASMPTATPGY